MAQQVHTPEILYMDMISVVLTGVTIILAALGFVVAVLAVVGWKSIQSIATSSAEKVVEASLAEGGELHKVVSRETRSILRYQGVEAVDTEFDEDDDESEEKNGG